MRAAVLHGPQNLRVEATSTPRLDSGDVLLRVTLAGLCGTDYSIWTGDRPVRYPRIMGHELLGVVEAVGAEVSSVRPGDRVALEPNYSCGRCPLCRDGNRNLCLERVAIGIDVDGGFSELVKAPERCCWPVPADVADEDLLLTEPLAVVTRAVGRGAPQPGESAAVVGGGTLGLLALQVLRARGARVMVVSRSRRRFPLALALGAEHTHALAEGTLAEAAQRFAGREGVDLVVETAGAAAAATHALELVRPGGRIVLTGLPHEPTPVTFFGVVRREITIMGSMIYQNEFAEAMRLVAHGLVHARPLITHRFGLDAIAEAFVAHRDPAAIKVALTL
ncbi:MAG: zinc-dependent alcohol dehydrogenase [Candidatus Rokuibacteriota bacterium]